MNEQQLRRLSDCEVHLSKYHDKLDAYLKQCDVFSNSTMTKQEFQSQMEDYNARMSRDFGMVRKDILSLKDENREINQNLVSNHEQHSVKLDRHQDKLEGQMFHVEQLQTFSENSHSMHGSHIHDIAILKDKMANCEKISPDIEEFKRKMSFFIMNSHAEAKTMKKCLDDLFNLLAERKISEDAMTSWVQQIEQKLNELPKILQEKIKSFEQDHTERQIALSAKFQSKLDNLPQPVAPEPYKEPVLDLNPLLEAFKKEILEANNHVLLDITNAKTKSDVNEMQLKIMDKKLENIYLLLKKHELTQ